MDVGNGAGPVPGSDDGETRTRDPEHVQDEGERSAAGGGGFGRAPEHGEEGPGGKRRDHARPAVLAGVLVVALGVVAAVVLTGNATSPHAHGADHGEVFGDGLPDRQAGAVSQLRAGDADVVVVDGVSGSVRVTATSDAHAVSGSYRRQDGRPAVLHAAVDDGSAGPGRRTLTISCRDRDSDASEPCAGDLELTVPGHAGLRLRQTSGTALIDGLGGDLDLDAASVRLVTRDLHSSHARIRVVSGSADLGFADAPDGLDLHAFSASAALRLPRVESGYAVTTEALSADVQVQVPQNPVSAHRVALTVTSCSVAVQAV